MANKKKTGEMVAKRGVSARILIMAGWILKAL